MPRKNIYIRNGDLAAWEAIENKAEWLHNRLNPAGTVGKVSEITVDEFDRATSLFMRAAVPTKNRTGFTPEGKLVSTNGVCKVHGLPLDDRGRCLQKGCKYS